MKFSELFRYKISSKCIYDEDKNVDIKRSSCELKGICEKICEIEENNLLMR